MKACSLGWIGRFFYTVMIKVYIKKIMAKLYSGVLQGMKISGDEERFPALKGWVSSKYWAFYFPINMRFLFFPVDKCKWTESTR